MKIIARIGTKIEKMAEAGLMVEVQDMDRNLHQVRLGVQDICLDLQDIKREAIIGTQGQARQDAERETRDLLILQELQNVKKVQLLCQGEPPSYFDQQRVVADKSSTQSICGPRSTSKSMRLSKVSSKVPCKRNAATSSLHPALLAA